MSTDTLTHPLDTQRVPQGGWRIDPTRSSVEFRAPTLWGLATVKGRFERYDGTLDRQQNPAIELTIDAASITTNLGFRDRHLRSADFFDVVNHPQVSLCLTAPRWKASGYMFAVGFMRRERASRSSSTPACGASVMSSNWTPERTPITASSV